MTQWTVVCQAPLSTGVLQERTLDWVAISFSRGSSWTRDWTLVPALAEGFFPRATRKPRIIFSSTQIATNGIILLFWWLSNIPVCVCVLHHLYPFICRWTLLLTGVQWWPYIVPASPASTPSPPSDKGSDFPLGKHLSLFSLVPL